MNLLYDGPHIQVLERRGSSDHVLVTFNERGFRADGGSIWAGSVADRLDWNAVGFVSKAPNWFPAEDLARACAAAAPALARFAERVGYGFSQGGYAAIKASRPLGLTHTLAVSPQCSIDPADVADRRFARFFSPMLNAGMRVVAADAPAALHLFYDRGHVPDREHADRIAAEIAGTRLHHLPSTGHETIRAFVGSYTVRDLVAAAMAGNLVPVMSQMRRASSARRQIVVERLIRSRRIDCALALFAAEPFVGDRRSGLLAGFAVAGAARRIFPLARADADTRPDDAMANAVLALALAKTGRLDEARTRIAQTRTARLRSEPRRILALAERTLDRRDRARQRSSTSSSAIVG